jgi:hypothetical protein
MSTRQEEKERRRADRIAVVRTLQEADDAYQQEIEEREAAAKREYDRIVRRNNLNQNLVTVAAVLVILYALTALAFLWGIL